MKKITLLIAIFFLSGCTGTIRIMSRADGKIYTGEIVGDGWNSASCEIDIGKDHYTGLYVLSSENGTLTLLNELSGNNTIDISKDGHYGRVLKGLLSSPTSNIGFRCESTSSGHSSGTGICIDSLNRIYDTTVNR